MRLTHEDGSAHNGMGWVCILYLATSYFLVEIRVISWLAKHVRMLQRGCKDGDTEDKTDQDRYARIRVV